MAYDERYEDFLNRMDVPIEAWEDKERLREHLREQLGYEPYDTQVEALWEYMETQKQEKWDDILDILSQRRQDLANEIQRLRSVVQLWSLIIEGRKVKVTPEEYLEIFDFIKKFQNRL